MNMHDFPSDATARVAPYGIYDVAAKSGHVYLGTSHDTPEFAVEAICRWWVGHGHQAYPNATRILILADSGGSNGCRARSWKERLQRQLADVHKLDVTVCHYPTGCSKWNPVEHRLFGPISRNWAGIPLRTLGNALALIRGTKTKTGLHVDAELIEGSFEIGRKVSNKLMRWLDIVKHDICPQWNYTLRPRRLSDPPDKPGLRMLTAWDLYSVIS